MKTYTLDQLRTMNYYHELIPLHKQLVAQGMLSKPTSTKRIYIENRIYKVMGKYDVHADTHMMKANLKACEDERKRNEEYIQELETTIQKLSKMRSRNTLG
jgi:hypothetical protein